MGRKKGWRRKEKEEMRKNEKQKDRGGGNGEERACYGTRITLPSLQSEGLTTTASTAHQVTGLHL